MNTVRLYVVNLKTNKLKQSEQVIRTFTFYNEL